ncbi:hypothetical protein PaecuDRAFT_3713 [Paenibacillus curdlanolyticus YK9]|uniref:Uncharacterized protein n=1 Tax=Paenibacillus curdlanolyticus YK9 TaxID=717606 RepID=E0IDK9_9BACL|nr:hypothetical protein PaecuDRAFT_3713 [Paenibacillus curdlanolyticus YK9]
MDIAVIFSVISIIVTCIVAIIIGQSFNDVNGSTLTLLSVISLQLSVITGILISLYARIKKAQMREERKNNR